MKYRVIKKDGKYVVQYKRGLFWKTVKVKTEYDLKFDSEKQAKEFVDASSPIRSDNR